jgi:hypothetical protein
MLLSTLDVRPSIALCSVLNGLLERGAPDGSAAIFRHDLILLPSSCMPQWELGTAPPPAVGGATRLT